MDAMPLLFSFEAFVLGRSFVAGVRLDGRALAKYNEFGDERWWLYGVKPDGIATTGTSPREAQLSLYSRLHLYLRDTAMEAASFEEFQAEVFRFFEQNDPVTAAEWDDAREAIRRGSATVPSDVIKITTPPPARIAVGRINVNAPDISATGPIIRDQDEVVAPTQSDAEGLEAAA